MVNIGGYYVTCDIHGNMGYLKQIAKKLPSKSTLIINGDILGSKTLNSLKKEFYEMKRGEIAFPNEAEQHLVRSSIHSGTYVAKKMADTPDLERRIKNEHCESVKFLNELAHTHEVAIYIITGNGEDTVFDFDITNGVDKETLKPTEDRFIKTMRFDKNITLVDSFGEIRQDGKHFILLGMRGYGSALSVDDEAVVFAHYPRSADVTKSLSPYFNITASNLDKKQCEAVATSIGNNCPAYFGHFHHGIPVNNSLPKSISTVYGIWIRPGAILQLK